MGFCQVEGVPEVHGEGGALSTEPILDERVQEVGTVE